MWRWLVVGAIASCGRIGFERTPGAADGAAPHGDGPAGLDGPADGGSRQTPALVQMQAQVVTATGGTAVLPIAATAAHDLLVLVASDLDSQRTAPAVQDDAGDGFTSTGTVAVRTGSSLAIWYVADSHAGATQVALEDPAGDRHQLWLLELANADPTAPLDVVQALSSGQETATAAAPAVAPGAVPAAVVAGVLVAKNVGSVDPPFVMLPRLAGDDAGYAIAGAAGAYGAQFQTPQGGGEYCAIAAAFRGAP